MNLEIIGKISSIQQDSAKGFRIETDRRVITLTCQSPGIFDTNMENLPLFIGKDLHHLRLVDSLRTIAGGESLSRFFSRKGVFITLDGESGSLSFVFIPGSGGGMAHLKVDRL